MAAANPARVASNAIQRRPEFRNEVGIRWRLWNRRSKACDATATPLLKPWSKCGDGCSLFISRDTAPQALLGPGYRNELRPALLWIVGENGTWTLTVGE